MNIEVTRIWKIKSTNILCITVVAFHTFKPFNWYKQINFKFWIKKWFLTYIELQSKRRKLYVHINNYCHILCMQSELQLWQLQLYYYKIGLTDKTLWKAFCLMLNCCWNKNMPFQIAQQSFLKKKNTAAMSCYNHHFIIIEESLLTKTF